MKIGIMGFGHLGRSLIKGLLNKSFLPDSDIYVTANSKETREKATTEYGVNVCQTNVELIDRSDLIFISLPSKVFFSEFAGQNLYPAGNKCFISLMAGVSLVELQNTLGNAKIIRAMPNLGIENNDGVIGYTNTDDERVIDILNHLGYAFDVPEEEIEKVTAFASCGIGFSAYILNCFFEAGKDLGFSEDISRQIVRNIFHNALQTNNYSELVSSVATKGGATETGIESFEGDHISQTIANAIDKAYRKMTPKKS